MTASDEPLPSTGAPPRSTASEWTEHRDLSLFNNALAIGVLGGAVMSVALPSLALITLKSTPLEVSVYAAQRFPPAVTALFGGAVVNRHHKPW